MERNNPKQAITKTKSPRLWKWTEPLSSLTVIPPSKTQRLSQQAKLANIDAERAMARAYQSELVRVRDICEALFKSGRALRFSLASSLRQIYLRVEAGRRDFEPGYRNR